MTVDLSWRLDLHSRNIASLSVQRPHYDHTRRTQARSTVTDPAEGSAVGTLTEPWKTRCGSKSPQRDQLHRLSTASPTSNWRILIKLRTDPAPATQLLRALIILTNLEIDR